MTVDDRREPTVEGPRTDEARQAAGSSPTDAGPVGAHPPVPERPVGLVTRVRRAVTGIRARVVVGYVLLVAAALGATTLVVRQVLLNRLDAEIERELAQEVDELRLLVGGRDPETGEPFGADTAAVFDTFLSRNVPLDREAFFTIVDGRPHAYSPLDVPVQLLDDADRVARWAALTEPLREDLDTAAGEARVVAMPLLRDGAAAGTFVVAAFPDQDQREIDQALLVIARVGGIALVITTVLAWALAGRVLQPVGELTATARRITDTDLAVRIPVTTDDELGRLGSTFNAMLDRLEAGFAGQRAFLNDVAHELRTPITIVRGHLEVMGDDPADRVETVELVTDELDRMSRYVSDLLVLAKAEQPDFLAPDPVDLGELGEDLLTRARALGDRRWVLDAAPRPGREWAELDAERITQAVLNLAGNAVEHTDAGDEIGIGVTVARTAGSAPDDADAPRHPWRRWWPGHTRSTAPRRAHAEARIHVRDTGPGIDPEIRATLFERSARAATSRARRPEGTGLGLSIVAAIAEAHGGTVAIESTPGHGATFTIVVPLPHTAPTEDQP